MSRVAETLQRLAASLAKDRVDEVELYVKSGLSHRFEREGDRTIETRSEECGWAVRGSGAPGAFFTCGTGSPVEFRWSGPFGAPIGLPRAHDRRDRQEIPAEAPAPLLAESEASAFAAALEGSLREVRPRARLQRVVLDDGAAEARLVSTLGMDRSYDSRLASLYVETVEGDASRSSLFLGRAAKELDPRSLGGRFGTALELAHEGRPGSLGPGTAVLAPAVGVRLLAGVLPWLVGAEAAARYRAQASKGTWGSSLLTIVDDGARKGSPLAAPFDGEGVETEERILVESGRYRQPLVSWRETDRRVGRASGCMVRPSWKEPPELAPTQLFVRPDPGTSPADLVESLDRGFYALDPLGAGRFDLVEGRFELAVAGFRIRSGRAVETVSRAPLAGRIDSLWSALRAVARDLEFHPMGCLLGTPTLAFEASSLDAEAAAG